MFDQETRDRFWAYIDVRGPDDCWEWYSGLRGRFTANGFTTSAPRFALWLSGRENVPGKPFACHTCDNPPCCNPSHLWWGDLSDNVRDAVAKKRHPESRKTHCIKGHEYTPENTLRKKVGRGCKECARIYSTNYARTRRRELTAMRKHAADGPNMVGMRVRPWSVIVRGYENHEMIFAGACDKAMAAAWRSDAFCDMPFAEFLKIARCKAAELDERFGERFTISGRAARYIGHNRQYVKFVWDGEETVLNTHPLDIDQPEARRGTPYYEEARNQTDDGGVK